MPSCTISAIPFRSSALPKKWWTMTLNPSSSDSTIRDIHAIREQLFDKFDGDITAILEDARQRQQASGRRILQRGELSNNAVHPLDGPDVSPVDSPLPVAAGWLESALRRPQLCGASMRLRWGPRSVDPRHTGPYY